MNISNEQIHVSGLKIDVVKKDIKNLHLGVHPPTGRVRVAAPLSMSDDSIRLFVVSRIPWINRQKEKFLNQERETKREYVTGESHYFLGKRYRLNFISDYNRRGVEIKGTNHINMYANSGSSTYERMVVMDSFYRSELTKILTELDKRWAKKLGIEVNEVRIKKMKTKWGSCNSSDKRIWINLELAKKSLHCIDYVFVHELIHIAERRHSKRFKELAQSALPNFEKYKRELNRSALGYSAWKSVD